MDILEDMVIMDTKDINNKEDIEDKLLILLVLEEVKECALNFDKCVFINYQL